MYQFLTWSFSTLVLEKYGNGCEDQIIFLVPSTQQTPVFVDRIEGMCINILTSLKHAQDFQEIYRITIELISM